MPKTSPSRFTMVPLRKSSEPTATRRARIIMGLAAVAALAGPLAVVVSFAGLNKTVDLSSVDPGGRAVADAAAFEVMAGEPLKIPTSTTFDPTSIKPPRTVQGPEAIQLPYKVDSLTWTGFDVNTFTGANRETTFEVHHYLMVPNLDQYLEEAKPKKPGDDPAPTETPAPTATPAPSGQPTTPPTQQSATPSQDGSATPAPTATPGASPEQPAGGGGSAKSEAEMILEEGITPYQLDVPVVMTESGPRLAAAPSIAPWTDAQAAPDGVSDYSNYSNIRVDANTQTARVIGQWAVAYAVNDEPSLLALTGDPNTDHRYVGLGGWTVPDTGSSVQILQGLSVNNGNQLLRVRVLLEDGRTKPSTNENLYRMYADFDILVGSPESATPQILAWGAAGAGAGLHAYSNAVSK